MIPHLTAFKEFRSLFRQRGITEKKGGGPRDAKLGNYQENPILKLDRELVNSENKWGACTGRLNGDNYSRGLHMVRTSKRFRLAL